MRKLVTAAITAALCAAATPAYAHPNYHYRGGCGFTTVSDGGDDEQTTWQGEVRVAVAAIDAVTGLPAAVPISAECHAYKNGVFQGVVSSASGIGVAGDIRTYVYQAHPDDIITICEIVDVAAETHTNCGDVPPGGGIEIDPVPFPAYGSIVIRDDGLGATMTTTYDPATWDCDLVADATGAVATCTPVLIGLFEFTCPLMILTTATQLTGKAGGRVQCGTGGPELDTGVIAGTNADTRSGDLGAVTSIVCEAYPGFPGLLVPPYQVTCSEPGAPEPLG